LDGGKKEKEKKEIDHDSVVITGRSLLQREAERTREDSGMRGESKGEGKWTGCSSGCTKTKDRKRNKKRGGQRLTTGSKVRSRRVIENERSLISDSMERRGGFTLPKGGGCEKVTISRSSSTKKL